ncbi:hypothetical protein ACFQ4C_30195 [Larkinella insperata]|uniref:Uncharacterized protein n=1 Tax=Larkinella insperata TaxID=332158 RepID=A0ABW3QGX9_9BACT
MNPAVFILVLCYSSLSGVINSSGQIFTVENVQNRVPQLVHYQSMKISETHFSIITAMDSLEKGDPLAEFCKNNYIFLNYILTGSPRFTVSRQPTVLDLSAIEPTNYNKYLKDTITRLNNTLHSAIQKDTIATTLFLDAINAYLLTRNGVIEGVKPKQKFTVSMPDLTKIAVRFFKRINNPIEKQVLWHLDFDTFYDASRISTSPYLEAFCYQTAFKWISSSHIYSESYEDSFVDEVNKLNERIEHLPNTPVKAKASRLMMQELMLKSNVLDKVLRKEFEQNKSWLGFIIN